MTYRDETLALREKLLELEADRARREGQRRGLEVALAEAKERAARADAAFLALPARARRKRTGAALVGWLAGTLGTVALLGGLCFGGVFTCDAVLGPDRLERIGTVGRTTRGALAVGARCRVFVQEVEDREGRCQAEVRCSATTLVSDEVACVTGGDEPEVFDHREGRDVVVSVATSTAVVRDAQGVVAIDL